MAEALVIIGGITLFLCVIGLLLLAVMLVRERQYWWAAASMFSMAVLIFLGLAGQMISEGWWDK